MQVFCRCHYTCLDREVLLLVIVRIASRLWQKESVEELFLNNNISGNSWVACSVYAMYYSGIYFCIFFFLLSSCCRLCLERHATGRMNAFVNGYLGFYPHHALAWVGIAGVWCPSVCPSVWCEVDVRWSYRLGYLEFYYTIDQPSASTVSTQNFSDLVQGKHPQIWCWT